MGMNKDNPNISSVSWIAVFPRLAKVNLFQWQVLQQWNIEWMWNIEVHE